MTKTSHTDGAKTSTARALRIGGTTAAALATLLLAGAGTADAGKKKDHRDVELVRPSLSPDADAVGTLRVTVTKRGEKGKLRLRNLDARMRYEVRDAATGELLGIVRTNRRGKAQMKLRRRVRAARKKASFEVPSSIEVLPEDGADPVLTGETDVTTPPPVGDLPAVGVAHYDGAPGWSGFVEMFSFPGEDIERFGFSLTSEPTERGQPGDVFDYSRDTLPRGDAAGGELPLGVASVTDLAGRAFRVVDGDGTVLLRGVLPDVEQPRLRMPPIAELPDFPGFADFPDFAHFPGCPMTGDGPTRDGVTRDGVTRDGTSAGGAAAKKSAGGFFDKLLDGATDHFANHRTDHQHHTDHQTDHQTNTDWTLDFGDFRWPEPGDLPNFMPPDGMPPDGMPPDFTPFPLPEREASRLRLEIADDEGNLTDVGNLDRIVFPEIDWSGWDWRDHTHGDPGDPPRGRTDASPSR